MICSMSHYQHFPIILWKSISSFSSYFAIKQTNTCRLSHNLLVRGKYVCFSIFMISSLINLSNTVHRAYVFTIRPLKTTFFRPQGGTEDRIRTVSHPQGSDSGEVWPRCNQCGRWRRIRSQHPREQRGWVSSQRKTEITIPLPFASQTKTAE